MDCGELSGGRIRGKRLAVATVAAAGMVRKLKLSVVANRSHPEHWTLTSKLSCWV